MQIRVEIHTRSNITCLDVDVKMVDVEDRRESTIRRDVLFNYY